LPFDDPDLIPLDYDPLAEFLPLILFYFPEPFSLSRFLFKYLLLLFLLFESLLFEDPFEDEFLFADFEEFLDNFLPFF
jgi:hypothetical protein